jgi:HAD superfamily hydrolase (TIGR01509 family)
MIRGAVSADLEAVTIDAYGTLLTLADPVPALQQALRERGVERTAPEVEAAFDAEVAYYLPRSHEGRDDATLALLRRDCAEVFLEAAAAPLDPEEFAASFVAALHFRPLPGAVDAVRTLSARGLRLAVVSNWDAGLRAHVDAAGLGELLPVVVTSAEAGAPKPDPAIFRLALERLGARAERTLHVGDTEADALGARAAGLRFAPAPLAEAVAALP